MTPTITITCSLTVANPAPKGNPRQPALPDDAHAYATVLADMLVRGVQPMHPRMDAPHRRVSRTSANTRHRQPHRAITPS